jgi:hypothetical protein
MKESLQPPVRGMITHDSSIAMASPRLTATFRVQHTRHVSNDHVHDLDELTLKSKQNLAYG